MKFWRPSSHCCPHPGCLIWKSWRPMMNAGGGHCCNLLWGGVLGRSSAAFCHESPASIKDIQIIPQRLRLLYIAGMKREIMFCSASHQQRCTLRFVAGHALTCWIYSGTFYFISKFQDLRTFEYHTFGQIIATSHQLFTAKGSQGFGKSPYFRET